MDNQKSLQCTPPSITYYGFLLIKNVNGTAVCGRFPVTKKEITIGRSFNCDIKIFLETVSDVHCAIYYIDDKAYIRDKSTCFTTKVNKKKIGKNNFLLQHSDEIEISGRKLIWEYANSYTLYSSKIGLIGDFPTSIDRRFFIHANTPQDGNNQLTPATKNMNTPSRTSLGYKKTPIVVAASNMSHSSFNELKTCFERLKTTTISQSEPRPTNLCSTVPGRNIPIIDETKSTPRKSWATAADTCTISTSHNSTSTATSILDQLSVNRSKRDSTPEFSYGYRYKDDSIQFDSPEPHSVMLNDSQNVSTTVSAPLNNLSDSEPDLSTSRRDTYSMSDVTFVPQQINTPTPGHSILKGSKTAKANRLRSSSRMVKFARLPHTDSKIKLSKNDISSNANFTFTDNETNEMDCSVDSKKSSQFGVEDLDDDLDGVQPLDSSVLSLMNSPIMDNSSVKKSSKRGSRGNKVMSLVNSIEKQGNKESPKNSIRASDLLSDNKSKLDDTSLNGSPTNANTFESVSSTRRINLENVFEFEDSLKVASCDLGNETVMPDEERVQQYETSSVSVNIYEDVSSEQNLDNTFEEVYNFASPLKLLCASNSSKVSSSVDHVSLEVTNENEIIEVIDGGLRSSVSTRRSNKSACTTTTNVHLRFSDINKSSVENTTLDHNNSNKVQNSFTLFDKTTNDNQQVNTPAQEFALEDNLGAQKVKVIKGNSNVSNDVLEYANQTTNSAKNVEVVSNCVETSSMIVDCVSTCAQLKNSVLESYVVNNDELSKPMEKSKLNNTCNNSKISVEDIIDTIKDQLDSLRSLDSTSYSNKDTVIADLMSMLDSLSKKSNGESITYRSTVEQVKKNVSSLALKVSEDISKQNESTENVSCSVSKTKSVCNNASTNDANNEINSNETKLPNEISNTVGVLNKSGAKNSSSTIIVDLANAEKENEKQNNSQNLVPQKMSNLDNSKQTNECAQSHIVVNLAEDVGYELCSTKPTRKILKVLDLSYDDSSDEEAKNDLHKDQSNINVENTLDASIGKPQCESTPWTSSKISKTKFNSATNVLPNETPIMKHQIVVSSYSPLPEPSVWCQMMKDFNESVKKASVSVNNIEDLRMVTKNLFNEQSACLTIPVSPVEKLSSGNAIIEDNLLINEGKNINTTQCSLISSCLPNSTTKTSETKRSSRISNNSLIKTIERRRSPRLNKSPTNSIKETEINPPKSTISKVSSIKSNILEKNSNNQSENTVLVNLSSSPQVEKSMSVPKVNSDCSTKSTKINLKLNDLQGNTTSDRNDSSSSKSLQSLKKTKKVVRTKKINSNPVTSSGRNLSVKINYSEQQLKRNSRRKNISEKTASNDTDESDSALTMSRKTLRNKLNVKINSIVEDTNKSILTVSTKKSETTSSKTILTEKVINTPRTRFTRSSTTLTEMYLPKLIKNNKTLSPVKTKAVKIQKIKKSKSSKLNKKTQPKRVLPSNPVITNSSSFESDSKDSTSESLIDVPPKIVKAKEKIGSKKNPQLEDHAPTTKNKDKNKKKDTDINPQLIDPPKVNKDKLKKKDFQPNDSSLSTKGTREKENNDSASKVASPLRTRSRKRPASTPVSQPNAKDPKRDTSTKATDVAFSVTNSPQNHLPSGKKCTRVTSKSTASQMSNNNSLPETTVNKEKPLTRANKQKIGSESSGDSAQSARQMTKRETNEMKKLTAASITKDLITTRAKKRDISPESSCDSAPSPRKMTRRKADEMKKSTTATHATSRTKNPNTRAKKQEISSDSSCDSAPSARSRRVTRCETNKTKKLTTTTLVTSKSKGQNTDEPTNTKVKFKLDTEEHISPEPKKTRATEAKNNVLPPRVLRTREKKK